MNPVFLSVNSFLADIFSNHHSELPVSVMKHISKVVDYDLISEYCITSDEVIDIVTWDNISRMKLVRILIRCLDQGIDILDKIKPCLNKYDYKVKELIYLLGRRPHYIEHFPIDLNKLKTSEAAILLSLGDNYFLNKIDMSKYTFNSKESMDILQGYGYDRNILEKVNYKSFKSHQISEILVHSGERDLDLLDVSKIINLDWLLLLEHRPVMLKYCDLSKFTSGDIFYSIRLCCMFDSPDLSYLVIDRGVSGISPFGWEKLLIDKPENFVSLCDFEKLGDNNWRNILKERPELAEHRTANL